MPHPTVTTYTAFVCIDCRDAVEEDVVGTRRPRIVTTFEGDDSIERVHLGTSECRHFTARDWHEWPDQWHDEHKEECETVTFSWTRCPSCSSTLGGSRHAVTVTLR